MDCKIIFSPQAIQDLEAVVRFIAKENPDAALKVGGALIDRVAILRDFPLIGSPYAKRAGIRKLVSHPYLIFYRFRERENIVDVPRYWHGARQEPDIRTLER